MEKSIEIILNAHSGSRRAQEMRQILERVLGESGRPYRISVAEGKHIGRLARERAATECEILVAGGGDGTICTVAQAALEAGRTLGVLPLGTFNYFAKSLRLPLELEDAAQVILKGRRVLMPVIDLDGRLVLNNASIGIHPAVLLRRRKLYRRWGRNQLNAYLSILLTAFQSPPRLRVRLATETGEVIRETPLVMVCANAFQMESFGLAGLECLDSAKFALYVAPPARRTTIFRLGLRVVVRRLRQGMDYEAICASDVIIEALRRPRLRVAVDGELEWRNSPLRFRMAAKPLQVLAPANEIGS
jgi:diacylglycerol kinase family enzyme